MQDYLAQTLDEAATQKMKKITDKMTLTDRVYSDGSPCIVDVFFDQPNHKAYQVDWRAKQWRVADTTSVSSYGQWFDLE